MSHKLARLEKRLLFFSPLKKILTRYATKSMGGEFLSGGFLDEIRVQHLSEVTGKVVFIFGAGNGNDLDFLPKDQIGQIVGLDITDQYSKSFLQRAAKLGLRATHEVGNVLDESFVRRLIDRYGPANSIVISFTLCCIRRPYRILQSLTPLLSDTGYLYLVEHVADLGDMDMFVLQQSARDAWMDLTGGPDTGGCDLLMDLTTVVNRTDLRVEDTKLYKDSRLYSNLAAFQQPILYLKLHK